MTLVSYLCSVVLQIGQFEGTQRDIADVFRIGTAIFALILFSLSLYAWYRRRQPALLVVSVAFLLFFSKTFAEFLLEAYNIVGLDLVPIFLDFITLALFFVAIVLRPRRKQETE